MTILPAHIADPRTGHQLAMLGLTHRDAPVAVRERCRLSAEQLEALTAGLRAGGTIGGCVYLQTCNRVEVYFTAADPARVAGAFREALEADLDASQRAGLDWTTRTGEAALSHLFRVGASLDSLVLGDTEILGQLRRAYESAKAAGWTDKLLNLACQWALKVGKGVRTHTTIQQRAASVASLVAQELRQGDPTAPIVLLGAGEIAQAVLRNLKKGSRPLVVLNRSQASLEALAKDHHFTAGRLQDFIEHVEGAAALVSCLAVETPL
ncbi:MAG TPA: glutamyl-tRNA reductase, partial [bacterium]|nr:glutamyl-tRNA reductase [bacterium]